MANRPCIRDDKSNEADMARVLSEHCSMVVDSVPAEASIELVLKNARDLKRYLRGSSARG